MFYRIAMWAGAASIAALTIVLEGCGHEDASGNKLSMYAAAAGIVALTISLEGCGNSSKKIAIDCNAAYEYGCFAVHPFRSCCNSCSNGNSTQQCTWNVVGGSDTPCSIKGCFAYAPSETKCNDACQSFQAATDSKDYCPNNNLESKLSDCPVALGSLQAKQKGMNWCMGVSACDPTRKDPQAGVDGCAALVSEKIGAEEGKASIEVMSLRTVVKKQKATIEELTRELEDTKEKLARMAISDENSKGRVNV